MFIFVVKKLSYIASQGDNIYWFGKVFRHILEPCVLQKYRGHTQILTFPPASFHANPHSSTFPLHFKGFIRFKGEGTAQQVIDAVKEANDGKIMIKGVETTVRILEG